MKRGFLISSNDTDKPEGFPMKRGFLISSSNTKPKEQREPVLPMRKGFLLTPLKPPKQIIRPKHPKHPKATGLHSLSHDLFYYLALAYLPCKSLLALNRTSKFFHFRLTQSSSHDFWKDLYRRDLTATPKASLDYRKDYLEKISQYRQVSGRMERLQLAATWDCEILIKHVNNRRKLSSRLLDGTLRIAVEKNASNVVKLVLDYGGDINTDFDCGKESLMRRFGRLIGADDAFDIHEDELCLLARAIRRNYLELARLLVERGARTDIPIIATADTDEEKEEYRKRFRMVLDNKA